MEARDQVLTESGQLVARLRKGRGWSLRELGLRAGVHRNQLSTFERSMVMPKADALTRVCAALELPPHLMTRLLLGEMTAAQVEAALLAPAEIVTAGEPAGAKVFVILLQSGAEQQVSAESMSVTSRGDLVLHDQQATAVATVGAGVWKECWDQAKVMERISARPERGGATSRGQRRVVDHALKRGTGGQPGGGMRPR